MHIVHVVESVSQSPGADAISVRGLVHALRTKGHNGNLISLESKQPAAIVDQALQPIATADIVHIHGWDYAFAKLTANAARKANRPYVISPLGAFSKSPNDAKGLRGHFRSLLGRDRQVRGAQALTALNHMEERRLTSQKLNDRVVRLPFGLNVGTYTNGANHDEIAGAIPQGPFMILLGPIHPSEGLIALLKSVSEIGRIAQGWSVVLAGRETGDWREMLEGAIHRKGGTSRVTFTDAKSETVQSAWLSRAAFLASPSLHTRCPVSVMQASAAGVPTMATQFVIPPGLDRCLKVCGPALNEIKVALRAMVSMSECDRHAMGEKARQAAQRHVDWSVRVDRFLKLYQSIL